MRSRIAVMTVALVAIVLLAGCGGVPKITKPEAKPTPKTEAKAGPLATIMVFKGEFLPGQAGIARGEAYPLDLNVGGSMVLTAMGRDANEKDIAIDPTWTPEYPGILEITPATGPTVTIRGLRKGSTYVLLEFSGVKRKFGKFRVSE